MRVMLCQHRMTRKGLVGLGIERCTSPLYIDWDPSACPTTAPDLFLNHFIWYWPEGLPKPDDLGDAAALERLQSSCDSEVSWLEAGCLKFFEQLVVLLSMHSMLSTL